MRCKMPAQPTDTRRRRNAKPGKERLDLLLVERGLAESREKAQALLLAGEVRVNGTVAAKAGTQVAKDARIEIARQASRYASRGGQKLESALDDFGLRVAGRVCMDVGSSTGGFSDCLLQRGARRVYAVDVSIDQLDWRLRQDPRVIPVRRNARYLRPEDAGPEISLVVADVSFISVAKVLPAVVPLAQPEADFLILIKPQFELERRDVGKGGIVREPALHQRAIERVVAAARKEGLAVIGIRPSRILGSKGNQEFFLHARSSAPLVAASE